MINEISLELYKFFLAVAEAQSISKAAQKLFVSQSAVSQAVMQLEKRLNEKLFDRNTRGVRLTPEGEVLYSYVRNAIHIIENAQDRLLSRRKLNEGEIRIGASDTICSLFLLPRLKQFSEAHPGIHLFVTNRVTQVSLDLLKNGTVDIAFVNLPVEDDPLLEIIPLMPIHDCFVVGKKYSFLASETLDLSILSNFPILMLEEASNSRKKLDRFLAENGVSVSPVIELGSLSLLADFAKIGLGISATIREDIDDKLESGNLYVLRFRQELPHRHIGLAKMKNISLSHAAKTFVEGFCIN